MGKIYTSSAAWQHQYLVAFKFYKALKHFRIEKVVNRSNVVLVYLFYGVYKEGIF